LHLYEEIEKKQHIFQPLCYCKNGYNSEKKHETRHLYGLHCDKLNKAENHVREAFPEAFVHSFDRNKRKR